MCPLKKNVKEGMAFGHTFGYLETTTTAATTERVVRLAH
jgi:hypothetical protein